MLHSWWNVDRFSAECAARVGGAVGRAAGRWILASCLGDAEELRKQCAEEEEQNRDCDEGSFLDVEGLKDEQGC